MNEPLVSVVLPTYNRADVLSRAIDSVLAQTYDDFELLVIDDGSVDETRERVTSYDDSRIKYLPLERNRGASTARNIGIDHAQGQYVAFQDSDDEWLPEKLTAQVRVMNDAPPDVGIVYTGFVRIDGDSWVYVPGPNVETPEGYVQSELLKNNFITTACALVRKRCLGSVGGFDDSLPRLQDWDLWLRLSREYEFRLVDRPLLHQYLQPDSISRDRAALIEAKRRLLDTHESLFEQASNKTRSVHWARLGRMLIAEGDRRKGRKFLIRATRLDPSLQNSALVLASYLPGIRSSIEL